MKGELLVKLSSYYDIKIIGDLDMIKVCKEKEGEYFFGIVNRDGKEVIPPQYYEIDRTDKGNINLVKLDEDGSILRGLADKNGKILVEAKYEYVDDSGDKIMVQTKDGSYGYIDEEGNFVAD